MRNLILGLTMLVAGLVGVTHVDAAKRKVPVVPVTCSISVSGDVASVTTGLPAGSGVWYQLQDTGRTFWTGGDSASKDIVLIYHGDFTVKVYQPTDSQLLAQCAGVY